MNAPEKFLEKVVEDKIKFKLNGIDTEAFSGENILDVADREGLEVPRLCYKDSYRSDGNCRSCVVEIKGERVLAPSCCRSVKEGMEVETDSERAKKSQNLVLEMLLSDMPASGSKWEDGNSKLPHGELSSWANKKNVVVRVRLFLRLMPFP